MSSEEEEEAGMRFFFSCGGAVGGEGVGAQTHAVARLGLDRCFGHLVAERDADARRSAARSAACSYSSSGEG